MVGAAGTTQARRHTTDFFYSGGLQQLHLAHVSIVRLVGVACGVTDRPLDAPAGGYCWIQIPIEADSSRSQARC